MRWKYWTAAAVGTFAGLEGHAIHRRQQTLSLWLRERIGIEPRHPKRYILGPLFLGFLTWLAGHILGNWGPRIERASYDRGGWLPSGLTTAYNDTGDVEQVAPDVRA